MNGKNEKDAHFAIAELEKLGFIGVDFEDNPKYHCDRNDDDLMRWAFTDGAQKMSIITQNVDGLHRKAGSKHLTELHGRGDRVKCMSCGAYHCRHEYHDLLEEVNCEWLEELKKNSTLTIKTTVKMSFVLMVMLTFQERFMTMLLFHSATNVTLVSTNRT